MLTMKKRNIFWQTLGLAFILTVGLMVAGCANSDTAGDGETDAKEVPVATIVDQINETYPLAGADVLTEDLYESVYQLTTDMVQEAKIIVPLMNVKSNELAGVLAKPGQVERKWYVVDATDVPLGRLSAVVASVLRGKNKPTFTPHTDTGDFVIVINAEKVKLTGKKATDKIYYTHSNHPGGLKSISAGELRSKNAVRLIEKSVKGMLPHNTLGRAQGMKLKVFVGAEHTHAAQQPEVLDISGLI